MSFAYRIGTMLRKSTVCLILAISCEALEIDDARNQRLETSCARDISIWRSALYPVHPKTGSAVRLRAYVESRTPGAALSLQAVLLDASGKELKRVTELDFRTQLLSRCGELPELTRRVPYVANAEKIRIEVKLAGNPAAVKIRSLSLLPDRQAPHFSGIYDPPDPSPDLPETLRKLSQVTPAEAWVERGGKRPRLIVDGRETAYCTYKGRTDFKVFRRAGADLILSHVSGTTLFWSKPWDPAARRPDGTFDFSRLETELARMHANNPEARVILSVECDPDDRFLEEHPDCIFTNERGEFGVRRDCGFRGFRKKHESPDTRKQEHWAVSYASAEFQEHIATGLRALTDFLKKSPAGNIVIGFCIVGGHDNQFVQWEYGGERGNADYSPSHRRALQAYLKEKYGTDEALQQAWGDSGVTLENAAVFTPEEWRARPLNGLRNGTGLKIRDCREFISISTARMLRRFAGELKRNFGRRCVVQTFYSSAIWPQAGRLALAELAKNGEIDIVAQVSNYAPARQIGFPGASANFCIGAAHMQNLIYVQELDHRTWRSQITGSWFGACEPDTPEKFRAQVLRDAGMSLAYGGDGFYFYDMYGSWYHDRQAEAVIAEVVRAARWSQRFRDAVPAAEVAVFLDERERISSMETAGNAAVTAWQLSGLTPDLYHLDDLCDPRLGTYKLYVILSPGTMTAAHWNALKRQAFQPGKVVLMTGNPGRYSSENIELPIRLRPMKESWNEVAEWIPDADDPLTEKCTGRLGVSEISIPGSGEVRFNTQRLRHCLDDSSAKILARWKNGAPAAGVKRSPEYGTFFYSAPVDGLTPQLLYNAAREAGILPVSRPGNAVYAGNGILAVHRLDAPVEVEFPADMEFFSSESGCKIGEGRKLALTLKIGESKVVLYRPKLERIDDEKK